MKARISVIVALFAFALAFHVMPAFADDTGDQSGGTSDQGTDTSAQDQAQSTETNSDVAAHADGTPEDAHSDAGTTFDGNNNMEPSGDNLEPHPFSATPNQ